MDLKNELINYTIFGILTSVINILVYFLFTDILSINYIISNIVAWFVSVLFAYVTNRIWVFESENENILYEIVMFYGGRLFTGVLETILLILFIDFLCLSNTFSKIFVTIVVVILNYIFSKKIVF